MHSKRATPGFRINHIRALWDSRISSLEGLKKSIHGSVFVAFDIEGFVDDINEIGFAVLDSKAETPRLPSDGNLATFYSENEVHAHTIEILEKGRRRNYVRETFGYRIPAVPFDEVEPTLVGNLSVLKPEGVGDLILVGFAMNTEWDWISRKCPSLASIFTAWVDLQDIVGAQSSSKLPISLTDAVKPLNFTGIGGNKRHHSRAATDAVWFLALLCRLKSSETFIVKKEQRTLPLSHLPRPSSKHPFTARVTTADGDKLPSEFNSPRSLSKLFAKYQPVAVGLNNNKDNVSRNGVRIWWISLASLELLTEFAAEVGGSTIRGKEVAVAQIVFDHDRQARLQ